MVRTIFRAGVPALFADETVDTSVSVDKTAGVPTDEEIHTWPTI
jgi:hypothetical protein